MKTKLVALALFALTFGAVAWYPDSVAGSKGGIDPNPGPGLPVQAPVVDVVFVLDTTGSMSGLIETAKEKIWSIASTMASAQPVPEIRIGLVGYRDRGDAYVTKVVDLDKDLDSVYAALMSFEAGGGGDTPESVNRALYDAVNTMSWSDRDQAYRVVFLVGDAPPHMDYQEVRYPQIVAAAIEKGIVINTIQCGNLPVTAGSWSAIAQLGRGEYFQVDQAGGAVAYESPFDAEIAELSAKLDSTRLYYGSDAERKRANEKVAATEAIEKQASLPARARRGVFNAGEGGHGNLVGEQELVDAVTSGKLDLRSVEFSAMPEALRPLSPEEQEAYVGRLAEERAAIQGRIRQLAADRDEFIAEKVEEAGGREDSLDAKLYETVRDQAGKAGLDYSGGPAY